MTYPETVGFIERGGCSEAAAVLLDKTGRAAELRTSCLKVLSANPLGRTCNEVAALLDEPITSIRPRMTELRRHELIAKHGVRGGMGIWRLTDAGRSAAND